MIRLAHALVCGLLLLAACHPQPSPPSPEPLAAPAKVATPIEVALRAIAGGGEIPADLVIRYSDMHGMHGGSTISLNGSGALQSEHVDRGSRTRRAGTLSTDSVRAIVGLLVELEAWEQRTPPRQPVPDESAAGLTVRAAGHEARIWEWYNDMGANDRLSRVFARLRTHAARFAEN
ncbi:MAG TPA: hypothetical protein VF584_19430 [Longimicrobium sp.]|jgi:hypothetical protein